MRVKYKCNCGYKGESEVGYWMRCENKGCTHKNAFQIISVKGYGEVSDIDRELFGIKQRVERLEKKDFISTKTQQSKTELKPQNSGFTKEINRPNIHNEVKELLDKDYLKDKLNATESKDA